MCEGMHMRRYLFGCCLVYTHRLLLNPLALHCIQLAQCLFLRKVLVEIRHQDIRRALLTPEHAGNNRPGVQVKVRQHLAVSLQLFLRHARIHQPVGILEQLEVRLFANVGFRHSFDERVRHRLFLAVRAMTSSCK